MQGTIAAGVTDMMLDEIYEDGDHEEKSEHIEVRCMSYSDWLKISELLTSKRAFDMKLMFQILVAKNLDVLTF